MLHVQLGFLGTLGFAWVYVWLMGSCGLVWVWHLLYMCSFFRVFGNQLIAGLCR